MYLVVHMPFPVLYGIVSNILYCYRTFNLLYSNTSSNYATIYILNNSSRNTKISQTQQLDITHSLQYNYNF